MKTKKESIQFKDYQNLLEVLQETARVNSDQFAYKWFADNGQVQSVTWKEFEKQVKQASKSLIALGVEKGDKVGILSYTCYEWVLADMGIASIGSCTVGIYQSTLPKDCAHLINHSDSVLIFVENTELLEKVLNIRGNIPEVKKVILFHGEYHDDDWVIGFQDFLKMGDEISDKKWNQSVNQVKAQDTAAIVYTSGTTGKPKGAVLTHYNITFAAQSLGWCLVYDKKEEGFLFLPLAHIFARLSIYFCLHTGICAVFARSINTVPEDIRAAKPHFIPGVPRIFEKAHSKIIKGIEEKGILAIKLFEWAYGIGSRAIEYRLKKRTIPLFLKLKYHLAGILVFKKIQAAFGGRVNWCISGGAPIDPEIKKFFFMSGIPILEGLGMTENVSFSNVGRLDNYRLNWIGPAGPGIEQKRSESGEIFFRSGNVMKEYYKMPEETGKTISKDGWLRTGDLGEISSDGFLRITGRKKDIIITSGGKNIAPTIIENNLNQSKYISQVCVIGDQRNYLTALIVPDFESVRNYADEKTIQYDRAQELIKLEDIKTLIAGEVETANRNLPSFETIKKFTLADEFTVENRLLTPTLKIRKGRVIERYKEEIEQMYSG